MWPFLQCALISRKTIRFVNLRHNHFLLTGMSDLSCDRQVILNDHLDEGALDELYVYTGAAGRIANKYTYEDGAHVEIPEAERSK